MNSGAAREISTREQFISQIKALAGSCQAARSEFLALHGEAIEAYRKTVSNSVGKFKQDLARDVARISGDNATCNEVTAKTIEYLDWLQWIFWDIPYYAVVLKVSHERLALGIRTCGMAYLSARIIDDVVDRHFTYKGRHETLLSLFERDRLSHQKAEGLTLLGGLLVCFTGFSSLASSDSALSRAILHHAVESLRHTIVGTMMELSPRESWNEAFYERMVRLKNVDFWRALYSGFDTEYSSPLYPFLERYYALAQKLNDVVDFFDDNKRAQPNLLALHFAHDGDGVAARELAQGALVPERAEMMLASEFLELAELAGRLPECERLIALLKLGENLGESFRLGLFVDGPRRPGAAAPTPAKPLGLEWYSTFEDVVSTAGADALIEVSCDICKSSRRRRLFEKQGFHFHRCMECGHCYVSPRIRGELAWQIGLELDSHDHDSLLLEVQKFYAASICHLLRARAPGPRLLDIGFGRGYVLQLAKSYGFEAYGVDTSPQQVERLRPQFGERLHLVTPGRELPWGGFDAVVISHVIEHLERPDEFLGKVFAAMNAEGVLYVAVPDMNSVQFQLFGKKWEVISPLTHFQYFQESTLSRLLKDCLFTDLERVEHEPLRSEIAPRWMQLLRRLGASDAGELAIVCRRPAF